MITTTPGASTTEFKATVALVLAHVAAIVVAWVNPSGVLSAAQEASITKIAAALATGLVALYGTHRTWLKAQVAKAQAEIVGWATPAATVGGPLVAALPAPFNPADHLDPPPAA